MARLCFNTPRITAISTTVGNNRVSIEEEQEKFNLDDGSLKRLKKTIGLKYRCIVDKGTCTSDLCFQSARKIFNSGIVKAQEIESLIFVSQTPDYKAPSTSIILQNKLGIPTDAIAFDINLGCSGFIYGLMNAFSLVESGLKNCLLLVGDISSEFSGKNDKTFTPLMGDAGSAILIDNQNNQKSYFILGSDGSGFDNLIIPGGGSREPFNYDSLSEKKGADGVYRRDIDMFMNGGNVFNFTIKVVPNLIDEIIRYANVDKSELDYFVLHQANGYILTNIAKRIGVSEDKLPNKTQSDYGNQNSASIPGTINAYLPDKYSSGKLLSLFAGFGIGLSWGACITNTDNIYCPSVERFNDENNE